MFRDNDRDGFVDDNRRDASRFSLSVFVPSLDSSTDDHFLPARGAGRDDDH